MWNIIEYFVLLKKYIFFLGIIWKWNTIEDFVLLEKYFFSRYNIKILEITINNCYKCDLETIIDPNNSQYFWINRRDLEIESKRNWQAIFNKLFSRLIETKI